jgi:hypothetical protein
MNSGANTIVSCDTSPRLKPGDERNGHWLDRREIMMKTNKVYEAPRVLTLDGEALLAALGPSLSCTGFGGSLSC